MKILVQIPSASLSSTKGSVRMTPEQIKARIAKRKGTLSRLRKVKKPTDKTKARIKRTVERISELSTKLKIATKRGKAKPATKSGKSEKPVGDKKDLKAKVKPEVDLAAAVNKARNAYTSARIGDKASPATLAKLRARYAKAFEAYKAGQGKSESSGSDPVVLSYTRIMRPAPV